MTDEELLFDLYYNKHNYDNSNILYNKAKVIHPKIKNKFVVEWLNKQQSKQQTRVKVGKKVYLPIFSELPYSFQIDLTFFPRYKKQNKNIYVLFTAININTRYAFAYYGENKDMKTILNFLKVMEKKTLINSISCDEGTEFNNKEFKDFCKEENINLYFIKNDSHKLGIINRFHRTIKEKLTKYFISKDSYNWVSVIDDIINNYNHTVNRGIGIEPFKITDAIEHELILFNREKTNRLSQGFNKFIIGDKVRIINKKLIFEDKMLPKYSNKVYIIKQVFNNACLITIEGKDIRIKNDQLLKIDTIENNKDDTNMNIINKENKISNKIQRENLEPVILDRPKRILKPNSKYL